MNLLSGNPSIKYVMYVTFRIHVIRAFIHVTFSVRKDDFLLGLCVLQHRGVKVLNSLQNRLLSFLRGQFYHENEKK